MASPAQNRSRFALAGVVAVVLLSVAARVWLLVERPLWFDELFTVWAARLAIPKLFSVLANDSGPPLFYVLEKPFVYIGERFLSSDLPARLLSFGAMIALFAGAAALPTAASRRRFLLLCAVSPLLLVYAAEARAYALTALLALSLFLLALVGPERPKLTAAIVLLSAAILYTHYLGIFVVGALAVVSAADGRRRSALALLGGAALFAAWVPVMARQPKQATAWMQETPSELLRGILSALGGAGYIPRAFGPPLPAVLFAAGIALALAVTFVVARQWSLDTDLRRGAAFVVLFFGGVAFASIARRVAFAGRTEMAVLPVWLWVIALAADRGRAARTAAWAVAVVGAVSSAYLLGATREPPASARALEYVGEAARPGDVLVAGAYLYLPARLAADRGRLRIPVQAFPIEQAEHPGWSAPRWPARSDLAAVDRALDRAGTSGRVYVLVPPAYRLALTPVLARRGVMRRLAEAPEALLVVWTSR